MKTRFIPAIAAIAVGLSLAGQAQVITPDPNLPVIYPDGVYRSPDPYFASFNGPGLAILATNVELRMITRALPIPSGPNEIEGFNMDMLGGINVNGGPFVGANATGSGQMETFGKIGNTTGTFNTEMLSMNLSGTSPFGPFMIRESPTLPSLGQTTITDVGGGLYRIDSFFDVFTELSIDGGATWMPDAQGPVRVDLVTTPEPSSMAIATLAGAMLVVVRSRRARQPN